MLCILCRHVSGSLRHVNANRTRLPAALKIIGPDASSRTQDTRVQPRQGRRLLATLHDGQHTSPLIRELRDDNEAAGSAADEGHTAAGRKARRGRRSAALEGEPDAGEEREVENGAGQGEKRVSARPQVKAASGSGPRAMRAIRRKRAQGVQVVQPPRKRSARTSSSQTSPPSSSATTTSATESTIASAASEPRPAAPDEKNEKKLERWQITKAALDDKFKEGYKPRKRLSPDALPGIRMLHASDPVTFSTPVLAQQFKVSPEAIRRILKSKWRPSVAEEEDRRLRWDRRGEKIWTTLAELGTRPPKKWRSMGVGKVDRKAGEVPAWKRKKGKEKENTQGQAPGKVLTAEKSLDDHLIVYGTHVKTGFADRIA